MATVARRLVAPTRNLSATNGPVRCGGRGNVFRAEVRGAGMLGGVAVDARARRAGRLFSDSLLGFYRRRQALEGFAQGQSGVIDVVQRVASGMKLEM